MEFLVVDQLTLTRRLKLRGGYAPRVEEVPWIEELSFSLDKRKSLGIVGESREALRTLALAIVKESPISAGTIHFAGVPLTGVSRKRFRAMRHRIQAVFPDSMGQLSARMTVREAFREVLSVWHKRTSREEIDQLVESRMIACGLPEALQDLYPAELDAVERQLVAIARALLTEPELLICCGITEGLDGVQQVELLSQLRHLQEEFSLTLLILTDDLAVAHRVSDDIAVLHQGRLVEIGPAEEIVTRPSHDHTRRLVASAA